MRSKARRTAPSSMSTVGVGEVVGDAGEVFGDATDVVGDVAAEGPTGRLSEFTAKKIIATGTPVQHDGDGNDSTVHDPPRSDHVPS